MARNGRERTILVAIELLTLSLIVFPVLFFGGNSELYRSIFAMVGIVLMGLVLLMRVEKGPARPVTRRKLPYQEPWFALILFGLFGLVHVAQLIPMPAFLVRWMAGWTPDGAWARLTPNPEATVRSLLGWIPAAAIFAAVTLIYDTRAAARRLFYTLLLLATFTSIYGIAETISGHEYIWNLAKTAYIGSATGSFINRNHFASFMTLGLGAALGLGWYRRMKLGQREQQDGSVEQLLLIVFAAVMCLLGVLLSHSRGGLGSIVLAGFPVVLWFVGRQRRRLFALLLAGLVVTTVLINLWISHEPVTARFHELPEEVQTVDARPAAWLAALRVGGRASLLGAGAGTFEDQIRILPDTGLYVRYNHAHCDPLEVFAETGIVGLLSLFGAVVWVLISAARALSTRHSRFARALAAGGLAGIIAVLFHSLFDFPLQIPGVRYSLFALLAGVYLVAHRRLTR